MYKLTEFLSLVKCYKIVFGIDGLPFSEFFELTRGNRIRANYDYKLYAKVATKVAKVAKVATLNCHKYSFFVRIVNVWNNVPKVATH